MAKQRTLEKEKPPFRKNSFTQTICVLVYAPADILCGFFVAYFDTHKLTWFDRNDNEIPYEVISWTRLPQNVKI